MNHIMNSWTRNLKFAACSPNRLLWKASRMTSTCSGVVRGLPPAPCRSKVQCCSKCWCQYTTVCLVRGSRPYFWRNLSWKSRGTWILLASNNTELSLAMWTPFCIKNCLLLRMRGSVTNCYDKKLREFIHVSRQTACMCVNWEWRYPIYLSLLSFRTLCTSRCHGRKGTNWR
jgi:hypothetical protein